jgi:hypothetical protein
MSEGGPDCPGRWGIVRVSGEPAISYLQPLSAPELICGSVANVAVRDWPDDFTFIIGNYRYRCRSLVTQFLSPRVSKLNSINATIWELGLEIDDSDKLFGSMLEAAGQGSIAVNSAHRRPFEGICAVACNSNLYESVCNQLRDEVTMDNVVDSLRFLSATQCDIAAELEFVAPHFNDLSCRRSERSEERFRSLYGVSIEAGGLVSTTPKVRVDNQKPGNALPTLAVAKRPQASSGAALGSVLVTSRQ